MARSPSGSGGSGSATSSYDAMLMAAMEKGDEKLETGRFVVTYNQDSVAEAKDAIGNAGIRAFDARDNDDQHVSVADVGESEAVFLPEIGVAIVNEPGFAARSEALVLDTSNPVEIVEPEYFVFAEGAVSADYMRGFLRAAEIIARESGGEGGALLLDREDEVEAEVLGATWGLKACRVPQSTRNGLGIRVAVLDTGMAVNHPDFVGRQFATATFVGQPVADLHGHGTHCIGTACGPLSPAGTTPRYGIASRTTIFVGKVLSNSGSGGTGSVLAGMNWAIAQQCSVISMSLGSSAPVQAAYTAAGRNALARGCLIIAAAGNVAGAPTGSPANSPTIMAVASLDPSLAPSSFSSQGKIEIAAPGRDVFSAAPMPRRYATMSGTSMATPHVAGCAALWAQTSPSLRGQALWNRLVSAARPLPFPAGRVGKGLVQAP